MLSTMILVIRFSDIPFGWSAAYLNITTKYVIWSMNTVFIADTSAWSTINITWLVMWCAEISSIIL